MFAFKRKTVLIVISLLLATGLTFLQYRYFKSMAESDRKIQVVVAAADIEAGEDITGRIGLKTIPQSAYVKGMYLPNEKVSGYAKVNISAGSYILKEMVSTEKVPVVENGMRRVTIGVNLTSSLAGKIRPGDVVDVGWVPKEQEKGAGSKVIAQKVQIYDVVNKMGEDTTKKGDKKNQYEKDMLIPSAVTLIVTPEQAVMIKYHEVIGSLFLVGY
ncbi:Flp pilus assembly protein CpaB [Thermosediminibacter oceani]|uniref:SAF domain protein n=1 Tax=Thermosediminibacter oceani (strain ATCC BAA-1034 / DSM 16646 / JW/IW-1228P) TaxID=555079 RepID=D9S1B7_THEOJ|nr:Flp pilus assembly protein CpaB [Thermosediminibacter oceani]ADL07194.1 SAF domain protein [Thermosediminibacter oceani DSM 16646]